MSTNFYDARLDADGNLVDPTAYDDPEPKLPTWYVTDPRTNLTKLVEADAEPTARWVAWIQWYGDRPRTDDEDLHYAALEVIPYAPEPPAIA